MGKHKLGFVAFDSAKEKHAVAIADDGRDGEVRYLGEIDNCSAWPLPDGPAAEANAQWREGQTAAAVTKSLIERGQLFLHINVS